MKRSDQDVENPFKTNEPRLEVEESATWSSPAAEEGPEGHNNSLVDKSASVKKALRLSLELRQELKFLQAAFTEENYGRRWTAAGMESSCKQFGLFLRGAISRVRFVPLPWISCGTMTRDKWTDVGSFHYHSKTLMFDSSTGSGCSPYNFSRRRVATG